jgi:hypothetical protein
MTTKQGLGWRKAMVVGLKAAGVGLATSELILVSVFLWLICWEGERCPSWVEWVQGVLLLTCWCSLVMLPGFLIITGIAKW